MNILKLLKSESRRTDFVFPDFIERHGSELMLDIDRAEWFIYSDSDEQWKADTIIDLYSTKEELESERVRSGNRPDPYSVYLNHVSTSSSLDRESFNSLFSCINSIRLDDAVERLDTKAKNAIDILLNKNIDEERVFRFLAAIKSSPSSSVIENLFDFSNINDIRKTELIGSCTKARDLLGRNSQTILDAMCYMTLKGRNDASLENKVVYQNFVSNIKNDRRIKKPVMIIDPSPFFVRKWLRHNPADNRRVIFILSDDRQRRLLHLMFDQDGISFCGIDEISELLFNADNLPTNIMFFGNHMRSAEIKLSILQSLISNGSGMFRLCIFDTDDDIENVKSVYNVFYERSYVDNVWLLPYGLSNETIPARKMMVNAIYGYARNEGQQLNIHRYALVDSCHLSPKCLTVQTDLDDLAAHRVGLRSLFRKKSLDSERKSDATRSKAEEFFFSNEISFFYTQSGNEGGYRIRAYVKDADSNRVIEDSKISARIESDAAVQKWLSDVYPYSVHVSKTGGEVSVQKVVTENLKSRYMWSDITLKSFIYFHMEQIGDLPDIAVKAIKTLMSSEISGRLLSDVDDEMLSYQIAVLSLSPGIVLNAMDYVFGLARSEGRIKQNPVTLLLDKYTDGQNRSLSDIRAAVTRKSLYKEEIKELLHLNSKHGTNASSLSLQSQLYTSLEPNIVNALQWKDYRHMEVAGIAFGCFVVRKQLSNDGSHYLNFTKRESYRIVPLPNRLSATIDRERKRQFSEIAKGDEDYLSSCTIVCGKHRIIDGQQMILAPSAQYAHNRKMIRKLDIEDDIIVVPDDRKGGIETNLAYYKGNIFKSNFRHWAVAKTGLFSGEECCYILGNKRPNTFSTNYCDYSHPLALVKLYLKMEKLWKEVLDD